MLSDPRTLKELGQSKQPQYLEVMQELHKLKQDLSRLNLAMASVIKSKVEFDRESEALDTKTEHYSRAARQLRKEIMDANEEHVLVELARIEAEKQVQEITSQRQKEAEKYAKSINAAKEVQDLIVLRNEMRFVRAMEKNYQNDPDDQSMLMAADDELIAAKKELDSAKEEGFQFMTSMDSIRLELIQITDENKNLKKLEGKTNSKIQNLNSRLMKFKSKLDHSVVSEASAKSIILNLESAMQLLQMEGEAANEEEQRVFEETENVVSETARIESQFSFKESRLRDVAEKLGTAQGSEASALRKLKKAIEKPMDVRTWLTSSCNTRYITISRGEFGYLSQQAAVSKVVTNKKVVAAQAWFEALDAGHKEISMKSDFMEKKIRELRAKEVSLIDEMEKTLDAYDLVGEDASHSRPNGIQEGHVTRPRRSSGIAMRQKKTERRRISASSTSRRSISSSSLIAVKKRKKMFPSLVKFLSNNRKYNC